MFERNKRNNRLIESSYAAHAAAEPMRHSWLVAAVAMLAVSAGIGLWPAAATSKSTSVGTVITGSASQLHSRQASSAAVSPLVDTGGGVDPGTPAPPVIGQQPMDATSGWVFPVREAHQMAGFSSWTLDQGVDLGFGIGYSRSFCGSKATLVAVDDGVITTIGLNGFGSQSPVLKITHGPYKGRQVYYGHSQPTIVHKGQVVKRGQAISHIGCGIVGSSSAPHLEFGLYAKGATYCCPSWGQTSNEVMAILKRMFPTAVAASKKRK